MPSTASWRGGSAQRQHLSGIQLWNHGGFPLSSGRSFSLRGPLIWGRGSRPLFKTLHPSLHRAYLILLKNDFKNNVYVFFLIKLTYNLMII